MFESTDIVGLGVSSPDGHPGLAERDDGVGELGAGDQVQAELHRLPRTRDDRGQPGQLGPGAARPAGRLGEEDDLIELLILLVLALTLSEELHGPPEYPPEVDDSTTLRHYHRRGQDKPFIMNDEIHHHLRL